MKKLGLKTRDLEKKKMDYLNLSIKYDRLFERFKESMKKIDRLEESISKLNENNMRYNQLIIKDSKLNLGI